MFPLVGLFLNFGVLTIYGEEEPLNIGALDEKIEIEIEKKIIINSKGDILKFGESIEIEVGEVVDGDVVAIGGSIVVRGIVDGDVVAVGGSIKVDSTGVIDGDVVAIGGTVEKEEGAVISGDEVSIGIGGLSRHHIFGIHDFGVPSFFTRTYSVIGKVVRIAILLILALLLAVFLPKPMARVESTVRLKFFATLGVGILGEILIFPLLVALTVSIIGIPFVPLTVLALIAGLIFGYAGVSLLLGRIFIERVDFKYTSPLTAIIFGVILVELVSLLGRLVGLGGGLFAGMGTFVAILGFLVTYIAWTLGLGAVILSRFGTREPLVPAAVTSSEESQSDQK